MAHSVSSYVSLLIAELIASDIDIEKLFDGSKRIFMVI